MGLSHKKEDITPSKDLQFFLFIVDSLREIQGKVKLFKLHYLVEREAHLHFTKPTRTYPLGPVDYSSFNYSIKNGLINEVQEPSHWGPWYKYSLTPNGVEFFKNKCGPLMKKKEKQNAGAVITKYGPRSGTELMMYVHKKYVDKFKDKAITLKYIGQLQEAIPIYRNLTSKTSTPNIIEDDNKNTLIETFYHMEDILTALKKSRDATERGTIITTIQEIFANLEVNQYKSDPYTRELVDFLDNYADKQGICRSFYSDDLSDIPKEERTRLFKLVKQMA